MVGAVFRKTLFDGWKGVLGWGLALALYVIAIIVLYPTITAIEGYREILSNLPAFAKGFLGGVDEMLSPEGYIAGYVFGYGPVVLAVYGILAGAAAVSGEEKRGTMDLLMSAPVPRWRVILEKFAAFIVSLLGVLAIMFVGIVIGFAFTPQLALPFGRVVESLLNTAPITLAFASLTFFLSTVLPSRFSAGLVTAALLVAFYMLNVLAPMSESAALESVQGINPFHYYGARTMFDGLDWGNVVVLLVVTAVLMALAVLGFERRDLAV